MRRLLIACLLLTGCGSSSSPPPPQAPEPAKLWPQPERYEVEARWAGHRLSGTLKLTLRNTGPQALRSVWLRTWPNAYGDGCRHPLATVAPSLERREDCTAQRVPLARRLAPGERGSLRLRFRVDVPPGADRFGRTRDVAYLGNAIPTLAVADEDGWRLPPYFDQGESWFTLAADWRVRLDAGAATVAATGRETRPGVHEAFRARDFALVIGRLAVAEARQGDITVRHFRLPRQPLAHARRALRAAKASLAAFERWYGPYGRRELDVVQGPAEIATRGIAMEYPELILSPPAPAAVAHEIAHQWWAFIMGNDPYREPFLDEGFAEYSQARLPRALTGGHRLTRCPRPKLPITADVPAIRRARGRAYVPTVYLGGGCFLRRLEQRLGTARFDAMLQRLVREHRDRTWTRADLIAAIERAASGTFDFEEFLRREAVTAPAG